MGEQRNKSQNASQARKIYKTKPFHLHLLEIQRLSTETVEGSALSLQGVNDIERGDSLSLGVLGVGDRVSDNVLEEDLEDTSGL
jgi:hypothetical protein